MRQPIRFTVAALTLALASSGAMALGDKRNKSEPAAQGSNSAAGSQTAPSTEKSEKGGTTQSSEKKGGTTDDNLGRSRADEKSAKEQKR